LVGLAAGEADVRGLVGVLSLKALGGGAR